VSLHRNLTLARFAYGPKFYLDCVVAKQQDWLEETDPGIHYAVFVFLCHHGVVVVVVVLLLLVEAAHMVVLRKCTPFVVLVRASNSLWWLLAPAGVHEVHRMAVILCTVYFLWINIIHTCICSKTPIYVPEFCVSSDFIHFYIQSQPYAHKNNVSDILNHFYVVPTKK
jgi:hypothetical protein